MKNLHFSATIDGRRHNFQIIARSWETSRAWGHTAELYDNDYDAGSTRIRYYNRTWERWTYEAACLTVLDEYVDKYETRLLDDYLKETGRKRIDAATRTKITRPASRLRARLRAHLEKARKAAW